MKQILIILGAVIVMGAVGAFVYTLLPRQPEKGTEMGSEIAPVPSPAPASGSNVVPPSPSAAPAPAPQPVPPAEVCAQDLKECPDGSYVTRGGPSCEFSACPSPKTGGLPVQIALFSFSPSTIQIHKGTMVTWTNKESALHTVTGDSGGPSSPTLKMGESYSYTFNTLGSFPYHCALHPSMKGTVTVVD